MKKAIGGAYVYNLVIIFLLIMFGFLMASYSYNKAFKVSKSVAKIIENDSGYNSKSKEEINNYLKIIGYNKSEIKKDKCPVKKGKKAEWSMSGLCIYKASIDKDKDGKEMYITYGIVSYMSIDLPLIELIRVPIYNETEKIYIFNK